MQLPLTHSVAAIQYQECLSGRREVSNDRSLQLKVKVHFCRNEKVHFVEMSTLSLQYNVHGFERSLVEIFVNIRFNRFS